MFDARYEKVRHDGQLRDCAVLIALGITPAGQRVILGVSVALSEAEVHWRAFFQSLLQRGRCGVTYIVSDDHPGMAAARWNASTRNSNAAPASPASSPMKNPSSA